jgi:hypothetical protein
MHPLHYHSGQLEVQAEANTRHVADKLAGWVGPAGEYATNADLVLLSYLDEPSRAAEDPTAGGASLRFAAVSGEPPLVMVTGPGVLELPGAAAGALPAGAMLGGLVIALERAERARINGSSVLRDGRLELVAEEAFTLCRKYMAPSQALETGLLVGPVAREPLAIDDPWARSVVGSTETAFLASIAPDGAPDVAHRGGPAGFLCLDADTGVIAWSELVGDGVFKSAGNVRATGTASLLALDLPSGDGLEITGIARYQNTHTRFTPREDPLVRMPRPFPEQGRIEMGIRELARLRKLTHPRRRLDGHRVTSRDTPDEQAPR